MRYIGVKSLTHFPTFDPNFHLDIQVNPPSSGSQENPTSWLVTSSLTIFTCKKQLTNFKYHFFILLPATHFQISIYTHQHRIIKKKQLGETKSIIFLCSSWVRNGICSPIETPAIHPPTHTHTHNWTIHRSADLELPNCRHQTLQDPRWRRIYLPEWQQMHDLRLESAAHPSADLELPKCHRHWLQYPM